MSNTKTSSAPKRRSKILIIVLAVVLVAAVTAGVAWRQYFRPYSPAKFRPNKWNEPYSQHIPLTEMNLGAYDYYFRYVTGTEFPDMTETIALPCDVRYYANPGDAEPVLTLTKGTNVHVGLYNENGSSINCWPDYQKGWRYGTPLAAEGSTEDTAMYFVRTADLKKVAKAFVDINWDALSSYYNFKAKAISSLVLTIDHTLYQAGCFDSPDL